MTFQEIISKLRVEKMKSSDGDRIDILIDTVCQFYNITYDELKSRSRHGYIVEARRMYCYLARVLTPKSLKDIGLKIDRDHATVLHQYKNMAGYVEICDTNMINDVNNITEEYESNIDAYDFHAKDNVNVQMA
jgi:chromosomal replication initiator protein